MTAHDLDRIQLLLHAGAYPAIADNTGNTPSGYIQENENLTSRQRALLALLLEINEFPK